jgi:type II secretory pathway predicted ATPase ExeA
MYANYWGLSEIPFKNTLDVRWFYESPGHEEAIARLLFLIEEHRRCGVLWGPSGTGKSLILELLRREAARNGGEVALVDVLGHGSREMLWEVLAGLRLAPGVDDSQFRLWRLLHDHALANRHSRAPLVLVLDHIDRAQADCLAAVERLQHLSAGGQTGLTLILGVTSERAGGHAQTLRDISDLRIDLSALDREQMQQYVESLLERAGAARSLFDASALDRLFDESRGVPREVNRLCDLALLAGMADQAAQIDESIVGAAAEELHVRPPATRSMQRFGQRFAAEI